VLLVQCNICGWRGEKFFDWHGGFDLVYPNAECGSCKSHPRHRYFYSYLQRMLPLWRPRKILHFAPEAQLAQLFSSSRDIEYLSVDLNPKKAMRQEDITRLSFSDGSFDLIVCIHVLEHVGDDRRAMSELHRILSKNGRAIIDVPIDYGRASTFDDPTITTPEARTKAYWQFDHVRLYGRDFGRVLESAGFKVTVDDYLQAMDDRLVALHGFEKSLIYLGAR
jgi:SAM-dependent methyltransferase